VTVAKLVPAITPENFQEKKCAGNSKTEITHAEVNRIGTVKHPDGNAGSPSRGACARGMVSHSISLPPGPIGAEVENQNGFCAVNHLNEPTSLLQVGDILESLDGEPFPKYCDPYQWAMFIYGTRNKPRRHLKIRRRETQPIPSTKGDPARVSIAPTLAANMDAGDEEFNSSREEEKAKRANRQPGATTRLQRTSLGRPEAENGHTEGQKRQTKHLAFNDDEFFHRVQKVWSRAREREENVRAVKKTNASEEKHNNNEVLENGTKAISSEEGVEAKQGETEDLVTNPSQRTRKLKRASSVGDDASSEEHDDNLAPLETLAGRDNKKRRRDVQDSTTETETELPSIRTTLRSLKTIRAFCQKKGECEELCEELERKIRDYWLDEAMSNDSPTMFG
jgi:hypothetical protein